MNKPEAAVIGICISTVVIVYMFIFTNISSRLKLWQAIIIWALISAAGFALGWVLGKDEQTVAVVKIQTTSATTV